MLVGFWRKTWLSSRFVKNWRWSLWKCNFGAGRGLNDHKLLLLSWRGIFLVWWSEFEWWWQSVFPLCLGWNEMIILWFECFNDRFWRWILVICELLKFVLTINFEKYVSSPFLAISDVFKHLFGLVFAQNLCFWLNLIQRWRILHNNILNWL